MRPVALTIAGSDPSGGAGLQADLVTFAALGVHGASVVTALTAQSTRGVHGIVAVEPPAVAAQLDAVLDDLAVVAAKTGMLHTAAVVEVVAERLRRRPLPYLVVDPVVVSTSGVPLLDADGVRALRAVLLPLATLVTPNLHEAETLTGRPVRDLAGMRDAARALADLGARASLVTGGHLPGDALDVLWDGHRLHEFTTPRLAVPAGAHGTGCVLSAAVTAALASGRPLVEAVAAAKRHVTGALAGAQALGRGAALLDLLYR